jgi:hypothetical protein
MRQYLAGDREMPLSASGLLVVSLVLLGAPAALLQPWIPTAVQAQIARRRRPAQGTSSSGP